ncbi:MAG: hypothetical protein EOM50_08415 [Erysipelotrichia bacterium]|nr:hypothetical protein [Erysipelotrichia bacterium]NCC55396.1 hypothetical protein [Erysipelotrichia bacterium]
MDNSVYLLSRNMNLMKCFLNCDYMNDIFKLEGLSTNINHFDCKSFVKQKNTIIIIDEIGEYQDHLAILKQLILLQKDYPIKLLFACSDIHTLVHKELRKLSSCKIMNQPLDFLTFLQWIQTQNQDRIVQHSLEKTTIKYLKYIGISTTVLGFQYLKEAILMKSKQSRMKLVEICDKIARENHTTSSRVERCMRTALQNVNHNHFAYLGFSINKMSCKEFIVQFADLIVNDTKE